jgi:hypothetical protein
MASWHETNRRILHFAAKLPPDRYMRVRAENVLNDTESQLPLECRVQDCDHMAKGSMRR